MLQIVPAQLQCPAVESMPAWGRPGVCSEQQGWLTGCGTLMTAMQSLPPHNLCGTRKQAAAWTGVRWGPCKRCAAAAHLAEVQQQAGVLLPLLLAAPAAHVLKLPTVGVHLPAARAVRQEGRDALGSTGPATHHAPAARRGGAPAGSTGCQARRERCTGKHWPSHTSCSSCPPWGCTCRQHGLSGKKGEMHWEALAQPHIMLQLPAVGVHLSAESRVLHQNRGCEMTGPDKQGVQSWCLRQPCPSHPDALPWWCSCQQQGLLCEKRCTTTELAQSHFTCSS